MKKHDLTDEEILQRIKPHVDDAQQAFYDAHLRNLSVDVLEARKHEHRSVLLRRATLALGTIGAAALLYLLPIPTNHTAGTDQPAGDDAYSAAPSWPSAEEADAYIESLVEAESVDLLSEAADADPLLLSDRDVDQLFEGL